MSELTKRIAGAGLFALDVVVRSDGSTAQPALGGSAGNVLSILGALGWTAVPIGVLGDDSAADVLADTFGQIGADLQLLRRFKHRCTPVVYQHQLGNNAGSTHRFTFSCPVCGQVRRPTWDDGHELLNEGVTLPSAGVFFLDRPTKLGVALARHYADQGALVVFEPSSYGDSPDLFECAMSIAHIVKYADERIEHLAYERATRPLLEIQTRGAEGLRFRISSLDNAWRKMGAYRLPYVRDTSGAGDWCTAGLIYELFRLGGVSRMADHAIVLRALAFGQALSSLNCLTEGARGLLAAWSTREIVASAYELSGRRRQTLRVENILGQRVEEPRLVELANDSRLSKRPPSYDETTSAVCCAQL